MAIDLGLEALRGKLRERPAARYPGPSERRAAVALVVRPGAEDTELLLIRRAERSGDPWSGHMALPGGHQDAGDADLLATARRETREEVGLDLDAHELLGPLDQHPAHAQGRFTGLVIAPYVFALRGQAAMAPNHEVAELLWAPLGRMARGEIDVVKELEREGRKVRFPAFDVSGRVVWGLTHRVLTNLFDTLR